MLTARLLPALVGWTSSAVACAFLMYPCLMQVNIGLRVLTRPIPAQLPEIYRTLGTDYAERVLPSIIQVQLIDKCSV